MKPALATAETQLLLFDRDTSTSECGNSYQAGDWVKLRRKPRIAAWVKRGDIFKINAVHPKDGSMQFWNPHINQWDFLYPEEVRLTLPPKEESVVGEIAKETVQSVVGEIAKETVESVVGEPQGTVESIVGEILAAKNYWNSDRGYSGNGWLESHYKIRRDRKQYSINYPEIGCTGPYNSYRWMDGKRQRAKYCPTNKCPAVRKALSLGQPINEILKIISSQ